MKSSSPADSFFTGLTSKTITILFSSQGGFLWVNTLKIVKLAIMYVL